MAVFESTPRITVASQTKKPQLTRLLGAQTGPEQELSR